MRPDGEDENWCVPESIRADKKMAIASAVSVWVSLPSFNSILHVDLWEAAGATRKEGQHAGSVCVGSRGKKSLSTGPPTTAWPIYL